MVNAAATRNYGEAIEATMEVVEYQPDRAFGVVIHDG
jgi:hypothetical protein